VRNAVAFQSSAIEELEAVEAKRKCFGAARVATKRPAETHSEASGAHLESIFAREVWDEVDESG